MIFFNLVSKKPIPNSNLNNHDRKIWVHRETIREIIQINKLTEPNLNLT